jgi:hypothetical protein
MRLGVLRGQYLGLLTQHGTITLHGYTIPQANTDHHIMHSLYAMCHIPTSTHFATTCEETSPPYIATDSPTKRVATDAQTLRAGVNTISHVSSPGARTIRSDQEKVSKTLCNIRLCLTDSTASAEVHHSYDQGRLGHTRWRSYSDHNALMGRTRLLCDCGCQV